MTSPNRISQYDEPQPAAAGVPAARGSAGRSGALQVIWARRWWVLLTTVLCVIGSFVYLSKQTPVYSSSSRLFIQQSFGSTNGTGPAMPHESGLATQCELIKSTPLLSQAAEMPEVKQLEMMRNADSGVNVIKSGLSVLIGSTNDIVTISYETPFRDEAPQVVNAVVDAYISYMAKQRSNTAAEILHGLQKDDVRLAAELKIKQTELREFKRKNGMLSFTDGQGNIVIQRLRALSERLLSAQFERMEAKATADAVHELAKDPARLLEAARMQFIAKTGVDDATPAAGVLADEDAADQVEDKLTAALEPLRAQIDQAELQLAVARRSKTVENDEVRDAAAQLEVLKAHLADRTQEIATQREQAAKAAAERLERRKGRLLAKSQERDDRLRNTYLASVDQRLLQAEEREAQSQKDYTDQEKLAFNLNDANASNATLETEVARLQHLDDAIADAIKKMVFNEDTAQTRVDVLEVAKTPVAPVRPDRPRTLGMGLVLGLLMGVGVALGLDLLDHRIRSADEVSAMLGIPVLGMVPNISQKETATVRGRKVHLAPTSDVAEAYRTVRTAVFFGARRGKLKKLLITSPAPGDGKSTSASNLAIAMAQAGGRTLLLDADLRRATQHKTFELEEPLGLCDVIDGGAVIEDAIHATGIENLDILPRGSVPSNPAEILNGKKFADLLEKLAASYDHVVIDSPPVTPVTDAMILGSMCDLAVLVLRAEKSTRRLSERALESLNSVGTPVLGTLINDVPRGRDRYGYYYGYGEGYRYYAYNTDDKSASNGRERVAAGNGDVLGTGDASDADDLD